MSSYFEIAYATYAKRLCLFTGTGFSKDISDNAAPSWEALLISTLSARPDSSDLLATLFPKNGTSNLSRPLPLEEAAQVIALKLAEEGKDLHQEISDHIGAIKLSNVGSETEKFISEQSYRVVTTNYDKLIETLAGEDSLSISPGQPIPRSNARVKTYHVHGSIDVPSKMVVTADDYYNFINLDSYFSRKLSTILHENTIVILGYSLGDANLKAILNEYSGYTRSNGLDNSIFFVSRKPIDRLISEYYYSAFGIRVIDNTTVEDFFQKLNAEIPQAAACYERSVGDIKKVLTQNHSFTDTFIKHEMSFYEIFSSIRAIGADLRSPETIKTIDRIFTRKISLTQQPSAWEQYDHLASWLCYMASFFDIDHPELQKLFLGTTKYSMESMSSNRAWGTSWKAYSTWDESWNRITPKNRIIIKNYIAEHSSNKAALSIVSKS